MKIKIGDAIRQAVDRGDFWLAGVAADALRFKCGLTYAQILALAQQESPGLTEIAWERLMYQADEECP